MFFITLVVGVAAATGEDAVFWENRAVTGWKGFALSCAYFVFFAPIMTIVGAWSFYMDRTVLPGIKQGIRRVFRRP
jgi:hypothetical protein